MGVKSFRDELKKRQLDEKKYMDPDTYKTYLGSFGAAHLMISYILLVKKVYRQ